jgi:hypothetical protein
LVGRRLGDASGPGKRTSKGLLSSVATKTADLRSRASFRSTSFSWLIRLASFFQSPKETPLVYATEGESSSVLTATNCFSSDDQAFSLYSRRS